VCDIATRRAHCCSPPSTLWVDVTAAGFTPSLMSSLLTTSAVLEENIVFALMEKKRTTTQQLNRAKKSC
jgi:hypothetical protein